MKRNYRIQVGVVVLCCGAMSAMADTPPKMEKVSDQAGSIESAPDLRRPVTGPDAEQPAVDISSVLDLINSGDIMAARSSLSRLQEENPGWRPPAELEQLIANYPDSSRSDNRYLSMMAELSAIPEGDRASVPEKRLEAASREVYRREDGYHAMMLGWIYYERESYVDAERLFTQAGQWGEEEQSRHARSLVFQQLAHSAVAQGGYAAALQYAEKAAELGRNESYLSTGWKLYEKEAYGEAVKAFSNASASAAKEEGLAEACLAQSRVALAAGNDALAEQAARCSQQHGRSDAVTALGWEFYKSGRYASASELFSARRPPTEESHYGNALALQAGGGIPQAREAACGNKDLSERLSTLCIDLLSAEMLENYQSGNFEAVLRQADEIGQYGDPGVGVRSLVAWSELFAGKHERAAEHFEQLLVEQPNEISHAHGLLDSLARSGDEAAPARAGERHPLVEQALMRRNRKTQEAADGTLLSAQSDGVMAARLDADRLSRAIELYHAEKYEEALEILQGLRAGIIVKRDSGLLTLSGWAAYHAGNLKQAREDFSLAAEWTDEPSIWLMVAEADIALGDLPRARDIAQGLPPSTERAHMLERLASAEAATAYEQGDYARAESLLSGPDIERNGGNLELLGWSRYQQEKYEAAAEAFEAAYRIEPDSNRAKGLVFSYIHMRQPRELVALADELQGPLYEFTDDEEVRKELANGRDEWVGVNSEGKLIAREPVKEPSALTRELQKLEGIPGFTWGSVDHSFDDDDTSASFLINQGIDWVVLPGDITVNTFAEYRSMDNDWQSVYDEDEVVFGVELKRSPINVGIEYSPARWRDDVLDEDVTSVYLSWYHSWYKFLRRRGSNIANPFDVNAYSGSTYGRISHQLDNGDEGTAARGFVRQGMDWFTSITDVGELTLNTYAAYRFRFRTENNY
ncbi:MAG: hypothetical protein R6X15_08335, partial [Pseudomonadota bacterium]